VQQAVNHHLIQKYGLPTALDFSVDSGEFTQQLVNDWKLLPTVAWLLGCKMMRGSLALGGRLAALPEMARRFVVLPVPCPAYPPAPGVVLERDDIEQIGGRYLLQLQSYLPAALAQRLALMFALEKELNNESVDPALPELSLNRSLLTFAFDYAKNSNH
jgi:type III secretion system OrgA/MxiK family protein